MTPLTAHNAPCGNNHTSSDALSWVWVILPDGGAITCTRDVAGSGTILHPEDPGAVVQRCDCMDGHNRPSQHFLPPANGVNLAGSPANLDDLQGDVRGLPSEHPV